MLNNFLIRNKQLFVKLSAALLAFTIAVLAFGIIAGEVLAGKTLGNDSSILLWIHTLRNPVLDQLFIVTTNFGDVAFVALATCSVVAFLVFKRSFYKALLMIVGVGGAALLTVVLKGVFERTRPKLWTRLIVENNFSFPSGHAMGSCAFAVALIAILWNTKWRGLAIGIGIVYVFFIGLSRLYLGVHYPTDIVAGWTLSLAWVAVVASLIYAYMYRGRRTELPVPKPYTTSKKV